MNSRFIATGALAGLFTALRGAFFVCLVTGLLLPGPALAVHQKGNIELDGNTVNDGVAVPGIDDWDDVFNASDNALRKIFVVDSMAQDSTSFTGGVKDTQSLNQWTCQTSTVQNKSNILNAYGATYLSGSDLILYAGADRLGNNGSANIGIWLFQSPVSCVSNGAVTPFTGTHIDGDLLLVAEFDQGGRVSQINVYRWSDPDGTPQSGDECLGGAAGDCSDAGQAAFTGLNCNDSNPGDLVCGRTNPANPVNAAWRAGIPTQGFYEAGANLTQLIGDQGCFANAIIETRSSTSLTATLKDFVSLDLSTCGTLTVEKTTVGGNATFGFSISPDPGAPGSPFTLMGGENRFFATVEPATYNVAENVMPAGPAAPNGWNLTGISCTGGTPGSPNISGIGHDGGNIDVGIDLNDDVVCTFTNTFTPPPGTITIEKTCDSIDDGGQSFDFVLQGFFGSSTMECQDDAVTLSCGESITCEGLGPASYQVDEQGVPGWVLDSVQCTDNGSNVCSAGNDPHVNITLAEGESATATFHNIQNASVLICKDTVPGGTGGDFGFTGDLGNFALADSFCQGPLEVIPGLTYDVSETPDPEFTLSDISCTGTNWSADSPTVSITPAAGEFVECTFTNTQNPGFVRVCKTTITFSDDNPSFGVNLMGPDGDLPVSSSLQHGECDFGPGDSGEVTLTVGAGYSVSEDAVEGWDSSVTCVGSGGAEDPGNIDVSANETVVCTFSNTQRGNILVVKQATGISDTFNFSIEGPEFGDGFQIGTSNGTGQTTFDNVAPGPYSIMELVEPPYVLVSSACDTGDNAGSFSVAPGTTVTCTFINTIPIPVPVNRTWALLILLMSLAGTAWYFRPQKH